MHFPAFCVILFLLWGLLLLFFPPLLSSVLFQAIWNLGWGVVEQNPGQRCLGEPAGAVMAWAPCTLLEVTACHSLYTRSSPLASTKPGCCSPVPASWSGKRKQCHSTKDVWLAAVAPFFHKTIIGSVHC